MGAIYVGKKLGPGGFEKEVVLKQLLPEFTSRPEFRDLFFREAKISATLDHQNVVRTFDLVSSNDRLFIVMEYVRGADLRTIAWRARRRRPLSPNAIVYVGLEILAGLAYAHGRRSPAGELLGIVHRDLSPSNILCSGEGEVKLSDFGIAKAVTYSSVFYRVRGKVGYMSPEMAHNQPIDARSDLFSLGVSLYETLIGERIYSGDLNTPPDQIYAQPVPPLASKCPGLPRDLQVVLDRALAIHPDDRFRDADSFAVALRQMAAAHGLLYSAPELAAELREIMGPNSESWVAEPRDHPRNTRLEQAQGLLADKSDSLVEPSSSVASTGANTGDTAEPARNPTPPGAWPPGSSGWGGAPPASPVASRPASVAPTARNRTFEVNVPAAMVSGTDGAVDSGVHPGNGLDRVFGADYQHPHRAAGEAMSSASERPAVAGPAATATRRSRRGLWLIVLIALAALLGFGFVRLCLSSAASSGDSRFRSRLSALVCFEGDANGNGSALAGVPLYL